MNHRLSLFVGEIISDILITSSCAFVLVCLLDYYRLYPLIARVMMHHLSYIPNDEISLCGRVRLGQSCKLDLLHFLPVFMQLCIIFCSLLVSHDFVSFAILTVLYCNTYSSAPQTSLLGQVGIPDSRVCTNHFLLLLGQLGTPDSDLSRKGELSCR